jgi:excisionase family DNA binding protein
MVPETVTFEPLMSVAEAAMHLRVHPATLRRWVKENRILAHHLEDRVAFRKSELDTWINGLHYLCRSCRPTVKEKAHET